MWGHSPEAKQHQMRLETRVSLIAVALASWLCWATFYVTSVAYESGNEDEDALGKPKFRSGFVLLTMTCLFISASWVFAAKPPVTSMMERIVLLGGCLLGVFITAAVLVGILFTATYSNAAHTGRVVRANDIIDALGGKGPNFLMLEDLSKAVRGGAAGEPSSKTLEGTFLFNFTHDCVYGAKMVNCTGHHIVSLMPLWEVKPIHEQRPVDAIVFRIQTVFLPPNTTLDNVDFHPSMDWHQCGSSANGTAQHCLFKYTDKNMRQRHKLHDELLQLREGVRFEQHKRIRLDEADGGQERFFKDNRHHLLNVSDVHEMSKTAVADFCSSKFACNAAADSIPLLWLPPGDHPHVKKEVEMFKHSVEGRAYARMMVAVAVAPLVMFLVIVATWPAEVRSMWWTKMAGKPPILSHYISERAAGRTVQHRAHGRHWFPSGKWCWYSSYNDESMLFVMELHVVPLDNGDDTMRIVGWGSTSHGSFDSGSFRLEGLCSPSTLRCGFSQVLKGGGDAVEYRGEALGKVGAGIKGTWWSDVSSGSFHMWPAEVNEPDYGMPTSRYPRPRPFFVSTTASAVCVSCRKTPLYQQVHHPGALELQSCGHVAVCKTCAYCIVCQKCRVLEAASIQGDASASLTSSTSTASAVEQLTAIP